MRATMSCIEKGERNVEILKQDEKTRLLLKTQIAIIYCRTKGLINNVPVNKVKAFEKNSLISLSKHRDVLDTLKAGKLTDEATDTS